MRWPIVTVTSLDSSGAGVDVLKANPIYTIESLPYPRRYYYFALLIKSRDIEFKRRYIKGTCVLIFLSCILVFFNMQFVSASICSAYIMCYIMLSKYGEKFMNMFKF